MNQPSQSKHTGRKIWYGAVIGMSALLIVVCAVAVVGAWVMQSKLSDSTVALLQTAENMVGKAQTVIGQVEEPLGEIEQIATKVALASSKLSKNVKDEGLLKLLLPPEQEQKLVTLATKVQGTLATIQEVLSSARELYQVIDRMPFISLPKPGLEKITEVQKAVDDIRLMIEELKGKVAEVRAGAVDKIGVVTEIAARIADRSSQVADKLVALDADLEGLKQTLAGVRGAVPTAFALAAFLMTLVLAYVGYTQVEVVRLFVGRWKMLAAATAETAEAALPEAAEPAGETPAPVVEENLPVAEPEESKPQE